MDISHFTPRMAVSVALLWAATLGCNGMADPLGDARRTAHIDRTELDMGTTPPAVPVEGSVRLSSRGPGAVQAWLSVEPADAPFVLPRRNLATDEDGTNITVQMLALSEGTFEATLVIRTNDSDGTSFRVQLRGRVQAPPPCDDGNPCTLDIREGDHCVYQPIPAACDDGNDCTTGDRCLAGQCIGDTLPCDDGVDCTVDSCQHGLGCTFVPRHEACDDGNACTADACVPGTGCQSAVAPNGTLCGVPACSALPMCIDGDCTETQAPDGFPCEDGDPCTLGDTCRSGACQKGLGEPMGVGDPVVVAVTTTDPGGYQVHPDQILGVQPLGTGRVRVAWRSRPQDLSQGGGECVGGLCGTPGVPVGGGGCLDPAADSFAIPQIHMRVTDATGHHLPDTLLPTPQPGMWAMVASASLAGDRLVVAARLMDPVWCCPPNADCAEQNPQQHVVVWVVDKDGQVHGPHTVVSQQLEDWTEGMTLPLHVSGQDSAAAVLWAYPQALLCLGACPDAIQMQVSVLATDGSFAVSSQGEHTLIVDSPEWGTPVRDAQVLLTAHEVHLGWRGVQANPFPMCGGATVGHSAVHMAASRGGSLVFQSVNDGFDANVDVTGVALAQGALGPAVFTTHDLTSLPVPCDCEDDDSGQCPDCGCVTTQSFQARQGGEVSDLAELTGPDGGVARVRSMSASSAFGRAVAVALTDDGAAVIASPALAFLPAISARHQPDPQLGVALNPYSRPVLSADGAGAWMGAVLMSTISLSPLFGVAVVPAGCGVSNTGTVWGWQALLNPDAGVPDAGALLDDGGVSTDAGPSQDGGALADGGMALDAGPLDDAGASPDAAAATDAGIPPDAAVSNDGGVVVGNGDTDADGGL